MNLLGSLFNIISLFYLFRAVQILVQIVRDWAGVVAEPLTREKQRLAEQAAFFISVPISVLIHELFHAFAVWGFGGEVVEFAYRVFWGYVVPAGEFTLPERWFIALSGTLGSLLFGLSAWLLLRRNDSRTLQYFGLRTFRFQVYFSLLYYPLMTLVLPIGDWRMIYDFGATPILSGATGAVHLLLLGLFWRADRQGWFEMPAFETEAEQARYEQLASSMDSGDPRATLQAIDQLRRGGATRQSQQSLDAYLAAHPSSAEAHLLQATLLTDGRAEIGRQAVDHAEEALALGLATPGQVAYAQQLVAGYYLQRGDGETAAGWLSEAIAQGQEPAHLANIYYLRSQANRRKGDLEAARRDATQAIELAVAAGDMPAVARYEQELAVVEKHQGGSGGMAPSTLPAPPPGGSD